MHKRYAAFVAIAGCLMLCSVFLEAREIGPLRNSSRLQGLQSMNPDIGVVLDFAGRYVEGKRAEEFEANRFIKRGAELLVTSYVDSFARLDIVANAEDDALDVEEAYATIFQLPFNTRLRLGKFFMPYGILNTYHEHDLPQIDRPLALDTFFGGEYKDQGVEGSWLLKNPWEVYSELTVAYANGDKIGENDDVASRTSAVNWNKKVITSRWVNFLEMGWGSSLLLGSNFGRGTNAANEEATTFYGLDAKYRYVWPDMRKATVQCEQIWWDETMRFDDGAGTVTDTKIKPNGGYLYAEYEFLPKRWTLGGRGDWSGQRVFDPALGSATDMSYQGSLYIGFTPSEFQRWRIQYRHSDLAVNSAREKSNEIMLQATFIIGFHPPHKF